MFSQTRLNELRSRKEVLLFQADVQRELLTLETQNVAAALRWTETVYRAWQTVKPWALAIVPVAGFFAARHGRSVWRWGRLLATVWPWLRRRL